MKYPNSGRVFERLWREGVGLSRPGEAGGRAWKAVEFANRMDAVKAEVRKRDPEPPYPGAPKESGTAFTGWLKGETQPQTRFRAGVLAVFYGVDRDRNGPSELERAWLDDDGQVPPPPAPSPGWQIDAPWLLSDDFARLDVHLPPDGPARLVALRVSVSLPEIYRQIPATSKGPELRVYLRPSMAELVLIAPRNMQAEPGTILGRDNTDTDVTYKGLWCIPNPPGRNENPLTDAELCQMRVLADAPCGFSLLLRCPDLEVKVRYHDRPEEVTEKQLAILRRVLQRMPCCENPKAEHVELARGGLHRGALP